MTLGRSVFGTTIEVYRLLALGCWSRAGRAAAITSGGRRPGRPGHVVRPGRWPTPEVAMPRDAALTDLVGEELRQIRERVPASAAAWPPPATAS